MIGSIALHHADDPFLQVRLTDFQKRALDDIAVCSTAACGLHELRCDHCGDICVVPNSAINRRRHPASDPTTYCRHTTPFMPQATRTATIVHRQTCAIRLRPVNAASHTGPAISKLHATDHGQSRPPNGSVQPKRS